MATVASIAPVLRVVPPGVLDAAEKARDTAAAQAEDAAKTPTMTNLASYIRGRFEMFKRHRSSTSGWSQRLLSAMRAFNGEYDPTKLQEIRKFGGSEVYARLIAMKCRGASSLLRDVYLGAERPWGLAPEDDPEVPPEIQESIKQLVMGEVQTLMMYGQAPDAAQVRDRLTQMMFSARDAAKKRSRQQAKLAEDKLEEILVEGNFYKALAEFIVDLPLFPFACIKGPTVKIVPTVSWEGGAATVTQKPKLFWSRVSPFNVFFTPGVSDIEDAEVIEKISLTRAEVNDMLDLPGYNEKEVRAVLEEYGRGGLIMDWADTDSEQAVLENKENPIHNQSGMITCLEFHGNVQGRTLLEWGMTADEVQDELRDYMVQAWLIGSHVVKVQMSPSPRKRHPFYVTSFEKVPGTPVGNGLPDILSDVAEVANATLRALVNNLSIASGPQVVINSDRMAPGTNAQELFPWKRWEMISDPFGNNTQPPVSFFQPTSNAQELLAVYKMFSEIADEVSAIPKYLSGGGASGGAGRTASGLAMLMGNASKILQTVAANVDRDVVDGVLTALYDMVMLTDDTGLLTGEEQIRVKGVNVAVQRETQRQRQLEFLSLTANPIDAQIIGPKGRAAVLRQVAGPIGLDGEEIVPKDEEIVQAMQQAQMMQLASAGAEAQGTQPGPTSTKDMGPRTKVAGGVG